MSPVSTKKSRARKVQQPVPLCGDRLYGFQCHQVRRPAELGGGCLQGLPPVVTPAWEPSSMSRTASVTSVRSTPRKTPPKVKVDGTMEKPPVVGPATWVRLHERNQNGQVLKVRKVCQVFDLMGRPQIRAKAIEDSCPNPRHAPDGRKWTNDIL